MQHFMFALLISTLFLHNQIIKEKHQIAKQACAVDLYNHEKLN